MRFCKIGYLCLLSATILSGCQKSQPASAPVADATSVKATTIPEPVKLKAIKPKTAPEIAKKPEEKTIIGVESLYKAYRDDLASAELKYSGKVVEISGVPSTVQKDGQGRFFLNAALFARYVKPNKSGAKIVSLQEYQNSNIQSALSAKYVPAVILYVKKDDLDSFADLQGKAITVRGRCTGTQADQSTSPEFFVVVENCEFVSIDPPAPVVPPPAHSFAPKSKDDGRRAKVAAEKKAASKEKNELEPLDLATVYAQEVERTKEFRTLTQSSKNQLEINELQEKQNKERDNLIDRRIEGTAKIDTVMGKINNTVVVFLVLPSISNPSQTRKASSPRSASARLPAIRPVQPRIQAKALNSDDPLLVKLQKGQSVKVQGILQGQVSYHGLSLEKCTFSLLEKD